jgi:hypothetical protein
MLCLYLRGLSVEMKSFSVKIKTIFITVKMLRDLLIAQIDSYPSIVTLTFFLIHIFVLYFLRFFISFRLSYLYQKRVRSVTI